MKKYRVLFILMLVFAAACNIFGQTKNYPFEVKKTGTARQSIIFIPGFASSGEVWDGTTAQLKKNFSCHVLTMKGFAGVKPLGEASFKDWEKGIADYIKDQKLENPIIIGHSMGGGLAMALAADYPELMSKIVVVDALPCLTALSDPNFKSKENNDCTPVITRMRAMTDEQFKQMQTAMIPNLVADVSKQETVIRWSINSDRATFAKMYCDFSNTDLREKIQDIKCPALVLLESYFVNFKPAIESQYKNLKNVDMRYASKGLHFIMYDDKEWYFEQLNNFLSSQ